MSGRRFPLDGAFAELRREVELLRDEMRGLRQGAETAASSLKDVGGSGGSAGAAQRTASASEKQLRLDKAREAERVSRQFVENFGKLRESIRTSVELTKRFGFPKLSRQAEKLADSLEAAEVAVKGIESGAKLLGAAFLPGAVAVGVTVTAVLALKRAVNSVTGSTLGIQDTIVAFALSAQKAFLGVKQSYLELSYAITGDDTGLAQGLAGVKDEILQVEGALKEIFERDLAKGPKTQSGGFFEDIQKDLGEFGDEVQQVLQKVLAFYETTQEAAKETKRGVEEALTPFQRFRVDLARMGDVVQNTYDFMLSGIQQVSATISAALLDAFLDPQRDIRETFASLFRAIAQQLLQLLIQAAIVKAASGIAGAFAGGGQVGGAAPVAKAGGGRVGHGGRASLAHLVPGVKGFAGGGFERPSWIPSSDTVPAWLTPGEFVEPLKAVRAYGLDFFERLRHVAADPMAMRAAAGLGARGGSYALGRGAFATGGGVSSVPAGGGGGTQVLPVLVADEAQASRIYAQGPGAFLRMVRRHRKDLRGILGV